MSCEGETGQVSTTEKGCVGEVEWRISDFSSLSDEDDAWYQSPIFSWGGHDWALWILPNGTSSRNSYGFIQLGLVVVVRRSGKGFPFQFFVVASSPRTDMLHLSVSLRHVNGHKECEQKCSRSFERRGYHLFPPSLSRAELLRRRREFLHSDVLTVVLTLNGGSSATGASNSSRAECCLCKEHYDSESIASHLKSCVQRTIQCPSCLDDVLLRQWIDGHECQKERTEGEEELKENCGRICAETSTQTEEENGEKELQENCGRTYTEASTQTEEGNDVAKKISFTKIRRATQNFSHELGSGGFGTVYKGEMDDGGVTVQIAVKKLKEIDKQFEAELKTLSSFKHDFLLSVIGYCDDPAHPCLVLEYMPNKSLEDRLACKENVQPLSWDVRLVIAYCSALGINHLHASGQVHRDVKSANILLDKDLFPKVADFGLVRIGESGESTIIQVTKNVCGTLAYMAPDAYYGDVSAKLDTFSFGVVLLELLTGLPAKHGGKCLFLYEDRLLNMLDDKARWDRSIAEELYKISKRCLIREKRDRPTISQILADLRALLPAGVRMLIMKHHSCP